MGGVTAKMTTRDKNNLLTFLVALAIVVVFFSVLSLRGLASSLFPTCERPHQHHIAFVTLCDNAGAGAVGR
jgi:hypothetical protein